MPIARSSLAGAATGVVLLVGAVGFGVGLPELVEDPGASTGELPTLPDRIDDRFLALSSVTAEDVKATTPDVVSQTEQIVQAAVDSEAESSTRLGEIYGDAVVRTYLDIPASIATDAQAAPARFYITVVPGDAGLVIPNGPFPFDQQGTHYELSEVDGRRCAVTWREDVDPTTGMPTGAEPTAASYQEIDCRAERGGLTYDISSSGLTPEETVGYLDRVLDLTEG